MSNIPQMNNNPLNLLDRNQPGDMDADTEGFARFSSPWLGWQAGIRQIKLDQGRGLTIREFIFKFAPPSENDTEAYLAFILSNLNGFCADNLLEHVSPYALVGIMAKREGYMGDV